MPPLREYHLFISHAWTYNDSYDRLISMLNQAPNFNYKDYSVPRKDPLDTRTDKQLYDALCRQIAPTSVVVVLSGMYTAYRQWMQTEIDIAVSYGKPIIGIRPWGNILVPTAVSGVAKEIVGWNTDSIVFAIRKYAP